MATATANWIPEVIPPDLLALLPGMETVAARQRYRVAIYSRISSDPGHTGEANERQEDDCVAFVGKHEGWELVNIYPDNDVSAFTGAHRPHYEAMLDAIRAGQIDIVVAWHSDRLLRTTREMDDYIKLSQETGLPTYFVKENAYGLDLTNAFGRMLARFGAMMAMYEAEHMQERLMRQKLGELVKGNYIGHGETFGYERGIRDENGVLLNKGRIGVKLIPREAKAYRAAVLRIIGGDSVYAILRDWHGKYLTPKGKAWNASSLRKLLTCPKHAGLVTYRKHVLEGLRGQWDTIISVEEHYAVVAALAGGSSRAAVARSLKWIGSGVYQCPCGGKLRSGGSGGYAGGRTSYRCENLSMYTGAPGKPGHKTGTHVTIRAEWADEYVRAVVYQYFEDRSKGRLTRKSDMSAVVRLRGEAEQVSQEIYKLDAQLDDMGDEFERTRVQRRLARAEARRKELMSQIRLLPDPTDPTTDIADAEEFLAASIERQRAIVDYLFEIRIAPGPKGRPRKGTDNTVASRIVMTPKLAA